MPSTEHVVFVPTPATGELDWAQLKQRRQVKLSADGQQVLLAPRTSAIHLQHSHGTVGDSADVQLPWPSLLAQVDLTATAGWSALLDSCQGGSNPVDRPGPVVDGSSSWVSRWLSQPGVHVRIQMHASPAATLEHTALVQAIPTVSALLNSATPDGNDGAPQSDRLARLVADPKAWVQLSPTDYYLYVDSWAVPGTPANTMPMDWLAHMSQRRPWFDRSNHVANFDHTLYWTLSLSAASSQTMAWAAWSWSTLPADGLQVSLCDNQQDSDSTQCDDLTLMTSTTHANTATYQGLSIQRSTDGLRPNVLHFADTLPPVSMTSQVTMDPPSSLHPHMVTSFLAASALEHTNLEDRTCQPKLLYHIAPVLFADPYQLADQTPVLGPFHHYGPIELEKPVDLVSAWGSVVTLDAPLPGLTKPTTEKARSNDAPAVNDGDVQVGRVDLPLHTRYKLPTFNTSTTAMGSQVYSFIRRPMAFVQCYDDNAQSRYPLGLQSVLLPPTKTTTALLNSPSNTTVSFVQPFKGPSGPLELRALSGSAQATVAFSLTNVYASQPLHPSSTTWEGHWVNIPLGNALHTERVYLATHLIVLMTCLMVGVQAWRVSRWSWPHTRG